MNAEGRRLPEGTLMVRYDPDQHHCRSIRFRGYDYTQPGAYFITICTYEQEPLFGEVVDGEMRVNEWGQIVQEEWFRTARLRPYVILYDDEFVVMPNHVHGIIWIVGDDAVLRPNAPVGHNLAPSGR